MSRLNGLALAAVMVAVTGCAKDSPQLTPPPRTAAKNQGTFDGPPKAVAAAAQEALEQMNVSVMPSKGSPIRLVGSSNGTTFALTFDGHKAAGVEKTTIHIEWIKGSDEQLWMDFMGTMMTALESQQRKEQRASN